MTLSDEDYRSMCTAVVNAFNGEIAKHGTDTTYNDVVSVLAFIATQMMPEGNRSADDLALYLFHQKYFMEQYLGLRHEEVESEEKKA